MITKIFFVIYFITINVFSFSQSKSLSMEEAVIGQWRDLYPETLVNLQWRGDNSSVTYQDYHTIYEKNITNNIEVVLLTLNQLNIALTNTKQDTLSTIPKVTFENSDIFSFTKNNIWYCYSISQSQISNFIRLPENAENKTIFFKTLTIAYTIDNNIFLAKENGVNIQITNDTDPNIVNGETVSRSEFGIHNGLFWSPKGNKLAFYRKDNSKVKDYPLVDITAREAEVNSIKYPMAGMNSEHISLGIYNIANSKIIYIEKEDTISEKYLTNISWDLEESNIYIQVLNREQNKMNMNKYSSETGKLIKTLFTEINDKYVEPKHTLLFVSSGKNAKFIYQTRKDGYNHAYLYNTNGELINQLTSGQWEITELHGFNGDYIYYSATKESPIERHVYKTNIANGKTQKLTTTNGTHNVTFNNKFKYCIDNFSNTITPRIISIIKSDGSITSTLKESTNPLADYNMPEMEINTIKSADNKTDLYYRLIKPANFDSTKTYPAIIYVYGGPHAQMINNKWLGGARMWQYLMAQKGYVILTVDNRGSANRGLEFENVIHRQCGVNEMKDQMKGVDLLKSLAYVDMNRIGVHGWSYGGFLTTSLMVNHPEVFKVGAAGGPVIDWKYYEVMYGERYMDTPEENPEGYAYTSLISRAKELNGKLLIVHGAIDPTVVMQHSQLFVRECIKNNTPIDYFIYPRAEHNVRGFDRIHLMQKVTSYFDDYLK